jgi:hypothetical protein
MALGVESRREVKVRGTSFGSVFEALSTWQLEQGLRGVRAALCINIHTQLNLTTTNFSRPGEEPSARITRREQAWPA